jgi:hypothetical protein
VPIVDKFWEPKPPGTLTASPDLIGVTLPLTQPHYLIEYGSGIDLYRDADKSLARPGRKQTTATEDFDVYISYL